MIYGYCRCSTDKQTIENQRFEIENFAAQNNLIIDKWVEETISSTKDLDKRKLSKLLKRLKKNDILIASELSRLGRNLLQVMGILSDCLNKECQVWTIKDNYRLGSDISSKVLAFAFGLSAEIERTLGRPVGAKNKKLLLAGKENTIKKLINNGFTKTQIAKMLKVDRCTLYYFIKYHLNEKP